LRNSVIGQIIHSRVVWCLGVVGWVWIAVGLWYEGLSSGFTGLKTTQVVIATVLAVVFTGAFIVERGWVKQTEERD